MENKLTDLENKVLNAAKIQCVDDYCADVLEISARTNLTSKTVKGVVGSLCKKGLMISREEEVNLETFQALFPIVNGELLSYGCDQGFSILDFQ